MRDFVKEVIVNDYNVNPEKVNDELKEKIFNSKAGIYSIEDSVNSWDEYFFNISKQVARNSKCLSRKIGAVLVKDKSIISTGYNGPPRGIPKCDERWKTDKKFIEKYGNEEILSKDNSGICPRYAMSAKSGQFLEICLAGHAEENAIVNAARHGIPVKGTSMYMTCGIPCKNCIKIILNSGVSEIIVTGLTIYDPESEYLINNSNLKVRLFDFLKENY